MTQYRISTAQANLRNEPAIDAGIVAVVRAGAIIHVDDERQPRGDWMPVKVVNAWAHRTIMEPVE